MKLKEYLPKADFKALEALDTERQKWYDNPRFEKSMQAVNKLKPLKCEYSVEQGHFKLTNTTISEADKENYISIAKELIEWRKGPFELFGEKIESEWRSDYKWDRIVSKLPDMQGKTILDIGCNNGYFMFRMLEHNPKVVLGIDPVIPFENQFKFIQNFTQAPNLFFKLWGVEHLKLMPNSFDIIFSMGILYHHRHPLEQLMDCRESLKPGGTLILETIGIDSEEAISLTPSGSYAHMPNVWFVPSLPCLLNWLERCKFIDIEVVSTQWGETNEQRSSEYAPSASFESYLDPNDSSKTIEGYPAPKRYCIKARRKPHGK